jgi:carbonic anhydrase
MARRLKNINGMKTTYEKLFEGNKKWVTKMLETDPTFFEQSAKEQKPPILWIGCSDSRVPANEVTGTLPGDIFVHRNIANMVVHTDLSMLSVLDYAVNILGVTDVIVCGHYGCGGIMAALNNKPLGLIENWLRNIKDVYRLHQRELDAIKNKDKRAERLVELNVLEQVFNLTKTSIVQGAWAAKKKLAVHGLVYDINTGILNDIDATTSDLSEMPKFYMVESELS